MYMRFNPYHGGLLMERLTLDEFRAKYPEEKLWMFDAFSGAVIPLAIFTEDPYGHGQQIPESLPNFINADIRIVSAEPHGTKRRTAITLEAMSEELFAPCNRLPNFAYDFSEFTFAKMWDRGSQVFMDSWTSVGSPNETAENKAGSNSNGWVTISQQGESRAYVFTMAFSELSIKKHDLLESWRMGFLRVNTQIAYDDDGLIVDIKRLNLRLGLSFCGSGLQECEDIYKNVPLPEVK